jgi:predicted O-linked N-acetylglucosamine transferase (SPINDLY family)
VSVAARFARAIAELQQGRGAQAAAICNDVVRAQPSHAGALHVLGIVAAQGGLPAAAADYLRRALAVEPNDPAVACNLGNALRDLRQPAEALVAYQGALRAAPHFAGALYGAGNALLDLGRAEEAVRSFDEAVALDPGNADAHNNRGNALLQLGRAEAALEAYARALRVRPGFELALANRTRALLQLERHEEALRLADRRIALRPGDSEAHQDRGLCLLQLERAAESLASYGAALAIQPDNAEALYGHGLAARTLQRHAEALADFERAQLLRPESVDILYRKAEALRDVRRLSEAAACFAKVMDMEPGREFALGNLIQARLQLCDWTDYRSNVERAAREVEAGGRVYLPGAFLAIARSPAAQLACARAFWSTRAGALSAPAWTRAPYAHQRIRVAYLSADFREHPVAVLLVGVLECHDRSRFETFGISYAPAHESAIGQRIRAAFDHCIDVTGRSDAAIAALLGELEIDIAVDLMGFSAHGRPGLFAYRPAPVQVSYLGYGGTMGTASYDYLIADAAVVPHSEQDQYSERIAWLPDCYLPCDDRRVIAPHTPTRASCGLPDGAFVYCCFNTHYKISPEVFDLWMDLLRANQDSVLWLSEGSVEAMENLRREATRRGVDAGRLVFAPRVPDAAEHLARYRGADLFLDTWPFGAHATASDALWAGLPVLTLCGSTFVGRVAASLLQACGMPELVATNPGDYRRIALEIGAQPARLTELRARLAGNLAARRAFNTASYCSNLETAYAAMWTRGQRQEAARSFDVSTE